VAELDSIPMKIKTLLPFCFVLFLWSPILSSESKVIHFSVNGPIHAVTSEYVTKAIDFAVKNKAEAIVFQIETPGGVSESMRTIISKMISSPIPVIVYVAPSGSRATSAGFFIAIASDLAVMAPGTHLGSAHPVFGGQDTPDSENTKTMMKKATEDSVAYIKTLAEQRGRNVQEAEKAVRDSISFTEKEALRLNLINFIATDLDDLLNHANGMTIKRFQGESRKLSLGNRKIISFEMTKRQKFLSALADPNISFILLSLGMLGLIVELYNPGAILPGIVGVICMALFFLSTQVLPINYIGLILVAFAIGLFVLELKIQSYGLLTIGGIVSLILGATMLFDAPIPEMKITFRVIGLMVALIALTMTFLLMLVISLHRKKPVTGLQGLLQEIGVAQTDIDPAGQVFVHGEIWEAVSPFRISKGEKVKILSVDGLTLRVEKFAEQRNLNTR
jgi:membrane-bound serine protease (ClpP class)